MKKMRRWEVVLGFVGSVSSFAAAKTLFQDDFSKGDTKWELMPGAGKITIVETKAPQYGPKAMLLESPSGNTIAFAKGVENLADGIVEVFWRDKEIAEGAVPDRDADGPVFFRAQGKAFTQCYLVEFDVDTGFHFDIVDAGGVRGAGPKSAGQWNWIKIRFEGANLRAKVWDHGTKEPPTWTLELEDKTFAAGFVGLRAWSGTAEVAFFRVSDLGGPDPFLAVEPAAKLPLIWGMLKTP